MPHVQICDDTEAEADSIHYKTTGGRMTDGRMTDGRTTDGRMLSRSYKYTDRQTLSQR